MEIRSLPLMRAVWAVLIGVAAYFSFWAVATVIEMAARPPAFGSHSSVEFTPLDGTGRPVPSLERETATYQHPYRFVSRLPDLRARTARVELTLRSGPQQQGEQLGLLLARRADVLAVHLNGRPITPDDHSPRLSGTFASEPILFRLPPDLLAAENNRIEIDVRRSLRDPFLLPDYTIAPLSRLLPAFWFRSIMIVEVSIVGLALMLLILLLCALIDWPSAQRSKMRAFQIALASSMGIGFAILFVDVGQTGFATYAVVHSLLSITLGCAALYYGLADGLQGPKGIGRRMSVSVAGILAVSAVLLSIYYTGLPGRFWLFGPAILGMLFAAFSLVIAAALLIWRSAAHGWDYLAERFALIIWFGAVAFDRGEAGLFALTSPFVPGLPLSLHWLPILGTIVGLAMIAVLARQASAARVAIRTANERLTFELAQREAELRKNYEERELLLQHHATQSERQRIMRDMHDGLGSQLISMLLAARRGDAAPARVADGLQAAINEMRLMIDSMDSVGDSLGSALGSLHERMGPRIEGAGLRLEWSDRSDGNYPQLAPRDILQVFRIMQEAVANSLKHAEASVLTIEIGPAAAPAAGLRIVIADNGKGFPVGNRSGRGLGSMYSRAAAIGGRLEVSSSQAGVRVALILPQHQHVAVAE